MKSSPPCGFCNCVVSKIVSIKDFRRPIIRLSKLSHWDRQRVRLGFPDLRKTKTFKQSKLKKFKTGIFKLPKVSAKVVNLRLSKKFLHFDAFSWTSSCITCRGLLVKVDDGDSVACTWEKQTVHNRCSEKFRLKKNYVTSWGFEVSAWEVNFRLSKNFHFDAQLISYRPGTLCLRFLDFFFYSLSWSSNWPFSSKMPIIEAWRYLRKTKAFLSQSSEIRNREQLCYLIRIWRQCKSRGRTSTSTSILFNG